MTNELIDLHKAAKLLEKSCTEVYMIIRKSKINPVGLCGQGFALYRLSDIEEIGARIGGCKC